jgi:hypothetical protein
VQIRDPIVLLRLDRAHDRAAAGRPDLAVEQHVARVAEERPRPPGDHRRADDPHHRVHPGPAEAPASYERDDREHRRQRVREHVEVGRAEVVIVVPVPVAVPVPVIVLVIVLVPVPVSVLVPVPVSMAGIAEQERAAQVDREAEDRDRDRLVEPDRDRLGEAHHALPQHDERHHREPDRAREAAEGADLAGAEAVAGILGVPPGVRVREHCDPERRRVGAHVPAVGEQGHRAEDAPGKDLGRHHRERDPDHPPGPPLPCLRVAAEPVGVRPGAQILEVHPFSFRAGAPVRPAA